MKVVQINTFPHKATGNIMLNLQKVMTANHIDSYVIWGRGRKPENDHEYKIQDKIGIYFHVLYSRILDKNGFASWQATKKLILLLSQIKPDVVHLHNIHGYYINIEMFFSYLRNNKIKIVWTLHDCWPLTGHCVYFDDIGCNKWITGCSSCMQLKTYPKSLFSDNSLWNWKKKKELFQGLDINVVCVSHWLSRIVEKSFLGDYHISIIPNGINLEKFHPIKSNLRERLQLNNKYI